MGERREVVRGVGREGAAVVKQGRNGKSNRMTFFYLNFIISKVTPKICNTRIRSKERIKS